MIVLNITFITCQILISFGGLQLQLIRLRGLLPKKDAGRQYGRVFFPVDNYKAVKQYIYLDL